MTTTRVVRPATTTAVVALRGGHDGKTRLASLLTADVRTELSAELARHVVGVLRATAAIARVLVVTPDPARAAAVLGRSAAARGGSPVEIVNQPAEQGGLNAAIVLGRAVAAAARGDRLVVVHADLPALTVADLEALLAHDAPLVLAPDHAATGTNALVLDHGAPAFTFSFGPGSFAAHRAEGARLGLRTAVVERPGLGRDLDVPADWSALPEPVRRRVLHAVPGASALDGLVAGPTSNG